MSENYILVIPVWGPTHTRLFVDVCIPSLLAPNNLPYLARVANVTCKLYVKSSEEQQLKAHPNVQKLAALMPVEFCTINFSAIKSNHNVLSDCHRKGLEAACAVNGYAILPPPDSVWSENSLRSLHQLVTQGIRVVHMACLRLQLEYSYIDLCNMANNSNDGILNIPAAELVKFTMPRMHQIAKSHFCNYYDGGLMPANLLWHVPDSGILAHCFHLHPILIQPTKESLNFKVTIDDDLLLGGYYAPSEIHIVQDSDEMLAYEISPRIHYINPTGAKGDLEAIVAWASVGTNRVHRELIRTPICLHYNDTNTNSWQELKSQATKFVEQVLALLIYNDEISKSRDVSMRKALWAAYTRITESVAIADRFFLGKASELHKSHWMYLAETRIYKPIAQQINKIPGTKCFIDDNNKILLTYLRKSFDVYKSFYITKADLLSGNEHLLTNLRFETIIYRVTNNEQDLQKIVDTAGPLLAENGKFIFYVLDETKFETIDLHNYPVQVINMQNLGGLGSRLALRLHSKLSSSSYAYIANVIRYRVMGILAKCAIRIASLPVKIVLYPTAAVVLYVLETFFPNRAVDTSTSS